MCKIEKFNEISKSDVKNENIGITKTSDLDGQAVNMPQRIRGNERDRGVGGCRQAE